MRIQLSLLLAAAAVLALAPRAEAADGKTVFTTLKCTSCHSIQAQAVEAVIDEEEVEEGEEAPKPKDLSDVGTKHDAKWIKEWLLKKAEIDGKTHRKKFPGTPAEMDVLASWLATLKTPAKP